MDSSLNIVLVEDHAALRKVAAQMLRQEGYRVTELSCAEDLDDEVGGQRVDIFILDLNLPGESGISLARRLRSVQPGVGIIMMTARDQPKDMEEGLVTGADQYLVKPVSVPVLLAAIGALARRLQAETQVNSCLHLEQSRLFLHGPAGEVHLSATEAALLIGLARAPGQRLALFQVGELMGQGEDEFNKASIEVRMARLRKKLIGVGAENDCLKALRNEGYQLCALVHLR